MISRLRGLHWGQDDDGAIVVGTSFSGIGHRCVVSDRDRERLNARGVDSQVELFVRAIVTENETTLYGFLDVDDRHAFDAMLKVNGLGPKTAIKVLSLFDAISLGDVIRRADVRTLTKVPGIGTKIAEKLCVEARL